MSRGARRRRRGPPGCPRASWRGSDGGHLTASRRSQSSGSLRRPSRPEVRPVGLAPGDPPGLGQHDASGIDPDVVRHSRPGRRSDGATLPSTPWADSSELSARVTKLRKAAVAAGALELEPGRPLVLYGMRHAWYTRATSDAGLTSNEAGAVNSTSGAVVEDTYLRRRKAAVMRLAAQVDAATRESGD